MWIALLNALFDSLCEGGPPRKADLIFVFAGRHERKRHGVKLWREGFAPTLVLSVERFEWRRFVELGLPSDGGLVDLVERTPPVDRHFFVVLDRAGARAYRIPARGLGTWREAQALADLLGREGRYSVLVVSSAIHLKRAASTLRALARGVRFDATAVPDPDSVIARDGWWRLPRARRAVLREALKLLLYRARLASRGPGA